MQYSSNHDLLILSLDCYVAIGLTSVALLISVCLNVVFCLLRRKGKKNAGMLQTFDFYIIYKNMNYDKSTTTWGHSYKLFFFNQQMKTHLNMEMNHYIKIHFSLTGNYRHIVWITFFYVYSHNKGKMFWFKCKNPFPQQQPFESFQYIWLCFVQVWGWWDGKTGKSNLWKYMFRRRR